MTHYPFRRLERWGPPVMGAILFGLGLLGMINILRVLQH